MINASIEHHDNSTKFIFEVPGQPTHEQLEMMFAIAFPDIYQRLAPAAKLTPSPLAGTVDGKKIAAVVAPPTPLESSVAVGAADMDVVKHITASKPTMTAAQATAAADALNKRFNPDAATTAEGHAVKLPPRPSVPARYTYVKCFYSCPSCKKLGSTNVRYGLTWLKCPW